MPVNRPQQLRTTEIQLPEDLRPVAQKHTEFLAHAVFELGNEMYAYCGRDRAVVQVLALMIQQIIRDADYLDAPKTEGKA